MTSNKFIFDESELRKSKSIAQQNLRLSPASSITSELQDDAADFNIAKRKVVSFGSTNRKTSYGSTTFKSSDFQTED